MNRRSLFRLLVVISAVLAVSACETTRQAPMRFPHVVHLAGVECGGRNQPECLTCTSCHAGVRDPNQSQLPVVGQCSGCHDDAAKVLAASTMPVDPDYPLGRAIRFDHKTHLDRPEIGGQCVKCHAGVVSEKGDATNYPPMSLCLDCHRSEFDRGRCTPCHEAQHLRRLRPETFSRHDTAWIRRHGPMAKRSETQCNQCHTQTQCNDCHDLKQTISVELRNPEKIGAGYVHRGDFITRHPIEARSQPATCLKCHSTSSCDQCHVRHGVSANAVGSANPHPVGWVGPDRDSKNHHGRAARRNIVSCAVCHDRGPATNCIRCHKSGAGTGNPHPGGWSSSRSKDAAMCRYCHEP
jgi:predicted CXXCH cytochrome family protein